MWGNIVTEVSFITNFHLGFNNTKSDILIHLTQWQYWWWFWFSYFWALYFLLLIRVFRFRVLKFNPRIVTSYRPHGKWGDLIVCLLPVSWCINIITNSNFILRMIEWQTESSLFTLRIRGKQWYWIYKFELKTVTDIYTAPKNVGQNRWVITNPFDLQVADDYLHILQLRTQQKWIKNYWEDSFVKDAKPDRTHVTSGLHFSKLSNKNTGLNEISVENLVNIKDHDLDFFPENVNAFINDNNINNLNPFAYLYNVLKSKKRFWKTINLTSIKFNNLDFGLTTKDLNYFNFDRKISYFTKKAVHENIVSTPFRKQFSLNTVHNTDLVDTLRWIKKGQGPKMPLRIIKNPLVSLNEGSDFDLFRLRWNTEENTTAHKIVPHSYFWSFKQKRYKRRKSIVTRFRYYRDDNGKLTKKVKHAHKPIINQNNMIIDTVDFDRMVFYRFYKKMKNRTENVSIPFNKRMLRTKKILVLPAHVNLTVITNSYDVVHSWFIPGLGLKLDCVPGRATHHVLHIDNVGFYYGQCAEICGRYHHHMPIRLCALPFEHFLIWWHSFGLPKMINTTDQKRLANYYTFRKYVW